MASPYGAEMALGWLNGRILLQIWKTAGPQRKGIFSTQTPAALKGDGVGRMRLVRN